MLLTKNDYALRGAAYEIQQTLEAFFGYCEVTLLTTEPTHPLYPQY